MKKIIKFLYSSKFLLAFSFLLNIGIYIAVSFHLNSIFFDLMIMVAVVTPIFFMSKQSNEPAQTVGWSVLILILPIFGLVLYMHTKTRKGTKQQRKTWSSITYNATKYLEQNLEIIDGLKKNDLGYANVNNYLLNFENMPIYQNSQSFYISSGEDYFKELFAAIKGAKKYILLEFFVIKPGKIWNEMFELLRNKAFEGVEIKLIYDDFGCLDKFKDKKYFDKLSNHKIEAVAFNKVQVGLNLFVNYRDHRKVAIIDGKVAFTGGVNIGDEYANIEKELGYFKDSAIKIAGPAVWNNIVMFFNNWTLSTKKTIDMEKYVPVFTEVVPAKNKEYIQPFGTGPLNLEPVARNLYIKLINTARQYLYITSPYFIIDSHMQQSLKLASQSGVDVKIIMPSVPDKKWLFYLSRAYYENLIKAGVKIYEYTPGFMHSKMMLTDESLALVGTANLDFRSLYLHFENGVLISNSKTINSIKYDFDSIINSSHLVSLRDLKQRKWYEKFSAQILKFFAPLI